MGVTPVDLFRGGKRTHAKLADVRSAHDPGNPSSDPDVESFVEPKSQVVWVSAAKGNGASCWNTNKGWSRSWQLPAGTQYPDSLRLWNDDNPPGHWTWAPAYDMPLSDFKAALAVVNQRFVPA